MREKQESEVRAETLGRSEEVDSKNASKGGKGNGGGGLAGGGPEKLDLMYCLSLIPDEEELGKIPTPLLGILLSGLDTAA